MSAAPIEQPEPDHDWLDVAEAVGVTPLPGLVHPALLTDPVLDAVVSRWATAYALPACTRCLESGAVEVYSHALGEHIVITCPDCGGDGGDVR